MTPEQSDKAAEALLQPSVDKLTRRQKRLEEYRKDRMSLVRDSAPVLFAVATVFTVDARLEQPGLLPLLAGIAVGCLVGAICWRSKPDR